MTDPSPDLSAAFARLVESAPRTQALLDAHWQEQADGWARTVVAQLAAAAPAERPAAAEILRSTVPSRMALQRFDLTCSLVLTSSRSRSVGLGAAALDLGWSLLSRESGRSAFAITCTVTSVTAPVPPAVSALGASELLPPVPSS